MPQPIATQTTPPLPEIEIPLPNLGPELPSQFQGAPREVEVDGQDMPNEFTSLMPSPFRYLSPTPNLNSSPNLNSLPVQPGSSSSADNLISGWLSAKPLIPSFSPIPYANSFSAEAGGLDMLGGSSSLVPRLRECSTVHTSRRHWLTID